MDNNFNWYITFNLIRRTAKLIKRRPQEANGNVTERQNEKKLGTERKRERERKR